jgi:hypothetical protein
MAGTPHLTDDDKGEITVTLEGKELRGWSYADETERRMKMRMARGYVEGWCDGRHHMEPPPVDRVIPYNPAWTHGEIGFDEADRMVADGWRMRPDGSWFKSGS